MESPDKALELAAFCAIHHVNTYRLQYIDEETANILEACRKCPKLNECQGNPFRTLKPFADIAGIRPEFEINLLRKLLENGYKID